LTSQVSAGYNLGNMTVGFDSKQSPTSLHQLTFILQHLADELLSQEASIGLSQVRIMGALHSSIPRSQLDIARALYQTEANVSRQLRHMKKQGHVSIARNKKDARQRDVTLTAKGVRQYDKAKKLLATQQKELLKLLSSSDTKSFNRGINHLLAVLHIN
jgi:DNA-binding MarR family transcriptional regulator